MCVRVYLRELIVKGLEDAHMIFKLLDVLLLHAQESSILINLSYSMN